ncbi:MAG: class I SAM-dependent methyltransferase [Planctomycetota bacterium]
MAPIAEWIGTIPDSTADEERAPNAFDKPGIESALSPENLLRVFSAKHGQSAPLGWSPKLQRAFGYFNPDDHYEAVVDRLIRPGTKWLDVGCGRSPFPNNKRLARGTSERCKLLVGVDPSELADSNPYVHKAFRASIEEFSSTERFDVVTLRMVVEHLENPTRVIRNLSRLTKDGGKVVVYTVSKWSPGTLAARLLPYRLHHRIKRLVWDVQKQDTFPAYYRLNTHARLLRAFSDFGFQESLFARLDDCSISGGVQSVRYVDLTLRNAIAKFGLPYPESCLIGVYEREGSSRSQD